MSPKAPARKPLISGNWKMHHNHLEAIQVVQKLSYAISKDDYDVVDVSVHPPFTDLRSIQTVLDADRIPILLGAQNCYWEEKGAFTGEVSPSFLAKLNVALVIVGHSERRQLFGETDRALARKVPRALEAGLRTILCVGETEDEREAGETERRLRQQVQDDLADVSEAALPELVIAYEPVWAIGTGHVATPEQAQDAIGFVRALVRDRSPEAAERVRVLYGGSVSPDNAGELMALPDVDGALVGGASLKAGSFAAVVEAAAASR